MIDLAPELPARITVPLDDVGKIADLETFANGYDLRPTLAWLRDHWQ